MEKREKAVSLNTIVTVLSVIAAVASAYFAFRATDIMESQNKPNIILDKGSIARIAAGGPCYQQSTASIGLGNESVGFNMSYSMDATVYIDNVGGKPVSVLDRMFAKDDPTSLSEIAHYFFITDKAQKVITQTLPIAFPLTLQPGETHALQLTGSAPIYLGSDLVAAQSNYEQEKNWAPDSISLLIDLGGGIGTQELTLPVHMALATEEFVLDTDVKCGS